jgi:hypothetical protein
MPQWEAGASHSKGGETRDAEIDGQGLICPCVTTSDQWARPVSSVAAPSQVLRSPQLRCLKLPQAIRACVYVEVNPCHLERSIGT